MFQTEPILFLQGISSDAFHLFMLVVNELGRPAPGMLLALLLISLDARKGFLLLQVLAVTAILTETLKQLFALPRPYFVDSNVRVLDRPGDNTTPFSGMDAESFFAPLPEAVVDYHRSVMDPHWGFPSGHVSSSIALWLALWFIYRRQWLLLATVFFTVATGVARLYLGKHFLADVLAGALLGASVALLACKMARHRMPGPGATQLRTPAVPPEPLRIAWLVLVPAVLLLAPIGETRWFAAWLGLNLGYLATGKFRSAQRNAGISARMTYLGIALAALLPLAALAWYLDVASAGRDDFTAAAFAGFLCFAAIAAPAAIASRLGAFRQQLRQ